MANIERKTRVATEIPNASMSDIAFILLIFFMVSTTFVKEKGLDVTLPKAKAIQKINRQNAATIYVNRASTISIDDFAVSVDQVKPIMQNKVAENPSIVTCFRTDASTDYGIMVDIMNELKKAEALRVSFEAKQIR
ncbi:MAG: biopolymer transporter ExbD [Candidatus Cloacimonetes bacterium]|nr:biopolymer transporter ExbD [Candidatus Cloacimonadota bacterium]MBS3768223.1 biopolymer transporter ExbD [Candidatus Cloacimonadota bacterium]